MPLQAVNSLNWYPAELCGTARLMHFPLVISHLGTFKKKCQGSTRAEWRFRPLCSSIQFSAMQRNHHATPVEAELKHLKGREISFVPINSVFLSGRIINWSSSLGYIVQLFQVCGKFHNQACYLCLFITSGIRNQRFSTMAVFGSGG